MDKQIISTPYAPAAIGPYSQAVKFGNLLFVSGQIPIDPATGNLVSGSIEAETVQVMKNISAVLLESGIDLGAVLKATIFVKNMNDFGKINEVYASYFNGSYPARETVEVARLPKDANVEISVIAAL